MQRLKLEQWKSYFWNNEQNHLDGIRFENMIYELLMLEYPPTMLTEKWHRTKLSWDGKRDFYQLYINNSNEILRWVECKARQETVSFNILAPTLIMSTLQSTNEVIFFSYSPLNREAINGLQDYAQIHQKCVRVFDDEKLEQLIFKYKEHPNFRFSHFFPNATITNDNLILNSHINCNVDIYVHRHHTKYSLHQLKKIRLKVNELLVLRVSLVNNTLTEQIVFLTLDLEKNGAYNFFDAKDRKLHTKVEVKLVSGGVVIIPFNLKITGYSEKIQLPHISYAYEDKCECVKSGYFLGSWLLETPYLGNMSYLEQSAQHTKEEYSTVLTVIGPSGSGKTRFLRELKGLRILTGDKCLWNDASHSNGRCLICLKQLLSQLYALPLIPVEYYTSANLPQTEVGIITDVLYDTDFQLNLKNIDRLALVLLKEIVEQDILLIVDNVQDFDEDMIQLINSMLNALLNSQRAHLLLSFNTDLLYRQQTAILLLKRLQRLGQDDDIHFPLCKINGLEDGYNELFINYCFFNHGKNNIQQPQEWRPVLQKILSVAGNNPLYLEQLLLFLCEKDVLRVRGNHLFIFDNYALPNCLQTVPSGIQELLKHRWNLFITSYSDVDREKIERILRFLCFFGEFPTTLVADAKLEHDSIDRLVEGGFVCHEQMLRFYHPLIERFLHFRFPSLTVADANDCAVALEHCHMKKIYSSHFYMCKMLANKITKEDIGNAILLMVSGHIPSNLVIPYGDILFEILSSNKEFLVVDFKKMLKFYIIYCLQQKKSKTLSEALKIYTKVYECYLIYYEEFRCFGSLYFDFIKDYMNALLTEHQSHLVIDLGEKLLAQLDLFTFNSTLQKKKAKAQIYNRMHVALDRTEKLYENSLGSPRAKKLLQEAVEISYEIKDPDCIIQNEIDFGYVFYLFGGPVQSAVEHWMQAKTTWELYYNDISSWEGGVFYHVALAHTLLHEWEEAKMALKRVVQFQERTLRNPYFYVKGLTLYSLILLITREPSEIIIEALDEAEDECNESAFKGVFSICSHIRAILYDYVLKNNEYAIVYYEKALTQRIYSCEQAPQEERESDMLTTLALSLRRLRGSMRCSAISKLKSRKIAGTLDRILESDEDLWGEIQNEPTPKGLLYVDDHKINYPRL